MCKDPLARGEYRGPTEGNCVQGTESKSRHGGIK